MVNRAQRRLAQKRLNWQIKNTTAPDYDHPCADCGKPSRGVVRAPKTDTYVYYCADCLTRAVMRASPSR